MISLAILIVLVAVAFWRTNVQSNPVVDANLFKGYDLKSVDHIQLHSASDSIDLDLVGPKWMVNKRFPADARGIEVLFATLLQAEPKRPVAVSQRDSIAEVLKRDGVTVTISSPEGQLEKFYAGGNRQKTQAYFLKESDNQPYVMSIPGYRVYVSGVFEQPEKDWRDKYVFGFNWRNFQSLETAFAGKPADGFTIQLNDNVVEIVGVESPDTARLNNYLDAVSLLTVWEYQENSPAMDDLKNQAPQLTIVVRDIGKREYRLGLYSIGNGRWVGLVGDSQWAIFAENRIRSILHPRSYFVGKPSE